MPRSALRVLCIHGVGHQDVDPTWQEGWRRAIEHAVDDWNPGRPVEATFATYDDLFRNAPLNPLAVTEALWKLITSGIVHGIGDLLHGRRGLGDIPDRLRWT